MIKNNLFKTRHGALGGYFGALTLLLVAVLVACPATPNPGPGLPSVTEVAAALGAQLCPPG